MIYLLLHKIKNEYISSALKYMLDTNIKKLRLRKNLIILTTLFDTIKFTDNFRIKLTMFLKIN